MGDDEQPQEQRPSISSQEPIGLRTGRCKWFNVAKGWGFITPDDGAVDVFVHQSVINMGGFRSLAEQEEVEFESILTERGVEATSVSAGPGRQIRGSKYRPRRKKKKTNNNNNRRSADFRRVRCYNCGDFSNHTAAECNLEPQPKRCYHCRAEDHLYADCPNKNQPRAAAPAEASNAENQPLEETVPDK